MNRVEIEIGKRPRSSSAQSVFHGTWDDHDLQVSVGGADTQKGRVPYVCVDLGPMEFRVVCDTPGRLRAHAYAKEHAWKKLLLFCIQHTPPTRMLAALDLAHARGVAEGKAEAQRAIRSALGMQEARGYSWDTP